MKENIMGKAILVLVGLLVFAASIQAVAWFYQFQGILLIPGLFAIGNPFAIMFVFAVLVFGGFYLVKISLNVLSGVFSE